MVSEDSVVSREHTVDYAQYIVRDPKICGGQPVIKGTRVTVLTVLASLAEGADVSEILADFPSLTEEAVQAVIAFAAATAQECLRQKAVKKVLEDMRKGLDLGGPPYPTREEIYEDRTRELEERRNRQR